MFVFIIGVVLGFIAADYIADEIKKEYPLDETIVWIFRLAGAVFNWGTVIVFLGLIVYKYHKAKAEKERKENDR